MKEKLLKKLKIASPFLIYFVIYMIVFYLIRTIKVEKFYHPYVQFDLEIPYIRYFIIPYFSWMAWVPLLWLYTIFEDEKMFKKLGYMMMISMTLYTLLSLIYPTSLSLRPPITCTDIFCNMTKFLHSLTPETYVFPSLHVFHSLAILYAIYYGNCTLFKHTWFKIFGLIWTILICLSTVFVRQHSMIDGFGALILFIIIWIGFIIYEKYHTKREN